VKVVKFLATVDKAKCTGCKLCVIECPTGAMSVIDKKARVEEGACVACVRCADRCKKENAIAMVRRREPIVCLTPTEDVDDAELWDLCAKAHRTPNEFVCICTGTLAGELAAAIIKGARSVSEVIKATGAVSGCQEFCVPVVQRLLKAYGVDIAKDEGPLHYEQTIAFWDLPDEIDKKYPQYCMKDDVVLARRLRQG